MLLLLPPPDSTLFFTLSSAALRFLSTPRALPNHTISSAAAAGG